MSKLTIGVLALQGDFFEHEEMLRRLGVETRQVRLPQELEGLDGLIIPGGESTTMGRLAVDFDLIDPLRAFGQEKPIWGTCAGAILLAKDVGRDQPILGLMNMVVDRNAFGRQINSFETDIPIPALQAVDPDPRPFHAVFIRAPIFVQVDPPARVLATLEDGTIVAVQQGHLLATAFHPELTDDTRFHRYFLHLVEEVRSRLHPIAGDVSGNGR